MNCLLISFLSLSCLTNTFCLDGLSSIALQSLLNLQHLMDVISHFPNNHFQFLKLIQVSTYKHPLLALTTLNPLSPPNSK